MTILTHQFSQCSIKELYDSMVYSARKAEYHLDVMIEEQNPSSGRYIDSKAKFSGWDEAYQAASDSLRERFGNAIWESVVKLINGDLEMDKQRKRLFG
jgi:hypothetical protein